MNKTTDVIIVGSGLAGLTAALAAASKNRKVRVFSEGMGCLAIGGGSIDVLGYNNEGQRLDSPWSGFENLSADHPYSLCGQQTVREALQAVQDCASEAGLMLTCAKDAANEGRNFLMPTIAGTLKPTYLFQGETEPEIVEKAQNILVLTVTGFRDCKPRLIINQLQRYKDWAGRKFDTLVLPAPFKEHGRSLTALDLAHVADRKAGHDWLLNSLKNRGKNYDLVLTPPIFGAKADSPIRSEVKEALGCPWLELLSIPPGVGALRLRDALIRKLHSLDVEFFENAKAVRAEIKDDKCSALIVEGTGRETAYHANAYIMATGGILAGGIILEVGRAYEKIFQLPIQMPENVDDWSSPEIFGQHLITRMGVKVDNSLRPVSSDGKPILENVYFAGRTLGGYDYASEKSGFGVAAATGWLAGKTAAN